MNTLKLTISALLASAFINAASAEESEGSNSAFALTGGYDTRLGDQWGVVFIADHLMIGGSVGGFIYSDAAEQSADQINDLFSSRYGDDPGVDGDATTYSFYVAYIMDPEVSGSWYWGLGLSGASVDAKISDFQGFDVSGSYTETVADFFVGVTGHEKNGFFYDIRIGYGYSMEFKGDVDVSGNGVNQSFDVEDESMLDGVYGMVCIGWAF
ncbi:MAG: hypothetical protein CML13_06985 [Puniceicoccaceae bacterium]|nr:hypothetical protein [Puniceicoccaceae bacterium]|tara:strand:+ start:28185 stop:28817 length:633 start_codon:yes stop_codon:yes gene_type:complete